MAYFEVNVIEAEDSIAHDTYQVLSPDGNILYSSDEWHSHETAYELAASLNYTPIKQELGSGHFFIKFYRLMISGYVLNFVHSSDIRYAVSHEVRQMIHEIVDEI